MVDSCQLHSPTVGLFVGILICNCKFCHVTIVYGYSLCKTLKR